MQKAIKRAIISGGYKPKGITLEVVDGEIFTFGKKLSDNECLLDPEFWKCLGKAEGWKWKEDISGTGDSIYLEQTGTDWKLEWHKLIDHLAEGKDINSFFDNLLK